MSSQVAIRTCIFYFSLSDKEQRLFLPLWLLCERTVLNQTHWVLHAYIILTGISSFYSTSLQGLWWCGCSGYQCDWILCITAHTGWGITKIKTGIGYNTLEYSLCSWLHHAEIKRLLHYLMFTLQWHVEDPTRHLGLIVLGAVQTHSERQSVAQRVCTLCIYKR